MLFRSLDGNESGEKLGILVADALRGLMRKIGIKSLKEMGYSRENVMECIPDVLSSFLSSFCPVEITEDVATNLVASVYDNYT